MCVCICVPVCRCPRVDVLPVIIASRVQSGGEDSQGIGTVRGCNPQGVKLCGAVYVCVVGQWKVLMVDFYSSTCTYVCSSSHTLFVRTCSKPDLEWCHTQLLPGWQTVSAPQHGALWSACRADWQVNDTNESQPSLPHGAGHWVTASKHPERASLNLKVISSTHSFSFSAQFFTPFSFSLASPSSASRWLALVFSPSFQTRPSLSLSLCMGIFHFHWRPLSFFTVSPPPLSFYLSHCLSLLCAVFYHYVTES